MFDPKQPDKNHRFDPQEKNDVYLNNKIFVGLVEENKDEKRKGRVKVRVQGVFNDIVLEHIPWSSPFRGSDGKNFSVPAIGKIVNVIFPQGNLYEPQYIYSENYNINLQDKLNDLDLAEYTNFTALLFDHRCQISVDDTALNLDYFGNAIRIKSTDIDIKLKDNTQLLNLGHSDCDQDAVLGTHFFEWMDKFMQTLLKPTSLVGNFGAPVLRPEIDQLITEYQSIRPTFVSNNVKIVDNSKISSDDYDNERLTTPTKDDSVKIDGAKILEPQTDNNQNEVSLEAKEKLKDNVKEERKKDLEEKTKNEPDLLADIPKDADDYDEDIIQKENEKKSANIEKTMNEDPYAGYWGPTTTITKKTVVTDESGVTSVKEEQLDKKDPYAGYWSNREGRSSESFSKKDGYGQYTTTTGEDAVDSGSGVNVGSSESIKASGAVSSKSVLVYGDLAKVQNSSILRTQSGKEIRDVNNGKVSVKADDIVTNMNHFIQDVLSPFATWLKNKYPSLYKNWYITSSSRSNIPKGGSLTSQHFKGQAIDSQILASGFKSVNDENLKLLNAIFEWYKENPVGYGQILFETRNKKSCWIHWSYERSSNPKLQLLRFVNDTSKTVASKMNTTGKYVLPPILPGDANLYT